MEQESPRKEFNGAALGLHGQGRVNENYSDKSLKHGDAEQGEQTEVGEELHAVPVQHGYRGGFPGGRSPAAVCLPQSREKLPFWENGTGRKEAWQNGWHGYDNELLEMRGFFLAYGPDFKSNFRAPPIRSVDVYNIMCNLAGVKPLPNNGSWSRVECMLQNTAPLAQLSQWSSCVLALMLLSLFA